MGGAVVTLEQRVVFPSPSLLYLLFVSVYHERVEHNPLIVEGLRTLLEARNALLQHAYKQRQAAEDALGDATKAVEVAEKEVWEVRQLLNSMADDGRLEKQKRSVLELLVEGPLTQVHRLDTSRAIGSNPTRLFRRDLTTGRLIPIEPAGGSRRGREWKDAIADGLAALLADGRRKGAAELFESLLKAGHSFGEIANPVHRIVQIMSADSRFEASRADGWGLAKQDGDGPAPPENSAEGR